MSKEVKQSRVFIIFLCCVLSMPTCAKIMPGVTATDLRAAVAAGVILGLAYLIVRPVMHVITLPVGCVTFGLTNLAIDVGLIWACGQLIEGFQVDTLLTALLAAVMVNALCAIAGGFNR